MPVRFDLSALSYRRSAKFVLAFFAAVVAITVMTFTVRMRREKKDSAFTTTTATPQPPARNEAKRVSRARLWPQFQSALQALGDRLEAPGKGRLILTGTIERKSGRVGATPIRMIVELPDKFRLEEQIGNKIQVTTFDGEKLSRFLFP